MNHDQLVVGLDLTVELFLIIILLMLLIKVGKGMKHNWEQLMF